MEVLQFIFSLITLFLLTFFLYGKYKLIYWRRKGVKSPPANILFGNFTETFTFRKAPGILLQDIYEYAKPNDPYIGFYIFHKPALLLKDLDLIKRIMVKDFDNFPNRLFGGEWEKDSVGLINLLSVRQPRWKYLRSKLTPSLTGKKLRQMLPLIEECGAPLLKHLQKLPKNSNGWTEVELKNLCSKYTTDIISSLAFGITTNSFNKEDIAFWEAGQKILSGFKRGVVLLIMFFIPEIMGYIQPLVTGPAKFFRTIFWDSVQTRENKNIKRGDLIESFIALKNENQSPVFKFEEDNLLAQAVAFFVAGFEATSTAIAFTLFELAQNQSFQDRLYMEINKYCSANELTVDTINEMAFLDCVINESLRLYPPLPLVDRVALEDYEIPDYGLRIDKNTAVYVSLNGINRDPKYFSNPTQFNPDREEFKTNDSSNNFAFGVGPRSCVGKRIGQLMTKVALITILKEYEILCEPNHDTSLNPLYIFTNAADGVNICLKKR